MSEMGCVNSSLEHSRAFKEALKAQDLQMPPPDLAIQCQYYHYHYPANIITL